MKTILRFNPSAAAADPGWVVRPPLPTTSARCPGHCDSATVRSRRPGVATGGAGAGGTAAGGVATAGGAVGTDAGAVERSHRVNASTATVGMPRMVIVAIVER